MQQFYSGMELYTCWSPQVPWEQMEVGQPALVVPNSDYWSFRKDAGCEGIISVMPQENCCMKTISLISAGLINTPPNV